MREIVKYRAHPSIIAIKKNCNASTFFNFSFEDKEDILKETKKLKANKATQNTDIPTKLIKENSYIFANSIFETLSKYQCGFRKGFSAQYSLLSMLKKWKSVVDNKNVFDALLMDLSKAFDCL